jgi:hypothetical protein
MWESKPTGTLSATPGLLRDTFTFNFYINKISRATLVTVLKLAEGLPLFTAKFTKGKRENKQEIS